MTTDWTKMKLEVYGGTWLHPKPTQGVLNIGECKVCGGECGHDLYSFSALPNEEMETHVEYTISDNHTALVQGIKDGSLAQLLGQAPQMFRLIKALAESDPMEYDDYGDGPCTYCSANRDEFPSQPAFVPHSRDCLWRQAHELIAACAVQPRIWGQPSQPFETYMGEIIEAGVREEWSQELHIDEAALTNDER